MKRLLLIVLTLAVSASVAVAQKTKTSGSASASNETSVSKQGRQVNLASNTALAAQLENSLDARRAKVGDTVVLKTTQAVKQNGEVIVPKGAKLIGHVTEVQQRTKSNGESRIGVAFDRLQKGALDMPITASIVSITQARSQTRADSSETMSSSSTSTTTRSSGGGQGGLLGGVGNTVGGAVNTTTSTVGNVAGTTTSAVGSTVGATTNTAANLTGSLKGLQITQSTSASAEGGSTLSLNTGNLRLESGATFNLLVSSSTNAGTRQ
jgi:hypothetical protein